MCEVEGIGMIPYVEMLQRKKKLNKLKKKKKKVCQFWPNFVQVVPFKYEEQRKRVQKREISQSD